jgi:outer membrane protein assembly factor BamB
VLMKRKTALTLILALSFSAVTGTLSIVNVGMADSVVDDWSMFHHDLSHSGYSTSTAPLTNNILWKYQTGDFVDSSPAVVDGVVYVGSGDKNVYALNASTGSKIWSYQTGFHVISSPAVAAGVVYVGSNDGNFYALNATTGNEIWRFQTGKGLPSSPAVYGQMVYFGTMNGADYGNIYALDTSTGSKIWNYTTKSSFFSSPAVAGGILYAASENGDISALNALTGQLIWSYHTTDPFFSSPTIAGGVVYIGSGDGFGSKGGKVFALDALNGTEIWSYNPGSYVPSSAAVVDGVVYASAGDGNVFALDASSGTKIWSTNIATPKTGTVYNLLSSPAVAAGVVYVGSYDQNIYALDATDGHVIWSYATITNPYAYGTISSPAVVNGVVYIGAYDGRVYAFGESTSSAQTWIQTYGGPDYEEAQSLVATSDGGYAIVGYTNSYGAGRSDVWLVKTDSAGVEQWNHTYGGTASEGGYSVVETSDGGYAITGYTNSYGAGGGDGWIVNSDVWLVKTDSTGVLQWNCTYGGEGMDDVHSVVQTSDGGYIIGARTESYGAGDKDFWLIKTDSHGVEQWNHTYGGTKHDWGMAVVQTSDGGYAMIGATSSPVDGSLDAWLVKTDSTGAAQWNHTYGGRNTDFGWSFVETTDGGYAITGYTDSYGAGNDDLWLVKTNAEGVMQWSQTYGGGGMDDGHSVVQTSDGGYAIAGYTESYGAGEDDVWLIKTDSAGDAQWTQTYGGADNDWGYSVVEANDGGYAIAGYTVGSYDEYPIYDFYVVKTNEFGNTPEAAWVILPLLLTATFAIFISKKKLLHKRSQAS